jgi:hypothetical protein
MPANPGGVRSTLTDGNGNPTFVIDEFYDPATFALRDRTITTSVGSRTGALIVDNMTGKTQQITATSDAGTVKTFSIPPSGRALTAAQLAAIPAPDGPILTIQDLAGLSPVIG